MHPYIGLYGVFPAHDAPAPHGHPKFRGVIADVTDGQVTLLGHDGDHMRKFMAALVLEDPTEARRRMPASTRGF